MSAPALRVAVVGLGVGARHLDAYLADPRCRVTVVCDLDADRATAATARCDARATADAAEAIAAPDVDAVSLATYDDAHAGQVVAALGAGKHVFVEKPLCRSAEELAAVAAAHARRPHLALASNLVLRAAPAFRWLRDARAAGELGDAYAFDGDYLYGRLPKIVDGWRGRVEGYSVMLGGGVHMVDLMMLCLGEHPAWVTATGTDVATRDTAFTGPDFAAATFGFPSGAVGRITANFAAVHRHQHVVRLFGTRASVVSDDRGVRLSRERDPAPAEDLDLAALPPDKGALIGGFVDAALGVAPQAPPPAHEMAVVAACIAADRSMRTGMRVEIDPP